jgi:hypothetical protein
LTFRAISIVGSSAATDAAAVEGAAIRNGGNRAGLDCRVSMKSVQGDLDSVS